MAMIGRVRHRSSMRMRRDASRPSMSGIWMSISTASKRSGSASTVCTPSRPPSARITSAPSPISSSEATWRFSALSSTTSRHNPARCRTRATPAAGWPTAPSSPQIARCTAVASCWGVTGLVRNAANGARPFCCWSASTSLPWAVIITTRGAAAPSAARARLLASPSSPGMRQSISTRSKGSPRRAACCTAETAASPDITYSLRQPRDSSVRSSTSPPPGCRPPPAGAAAHPRTGTRCAGRRPAR